MVQNSKGTKRSAEKASHLLLPQPSTSRWGHQCYRFLPPVPDTFYTLLTCVHSASYTRCLPGFHAGDTCACYTHYKTYSHPKVLATWPASVRITT